MKSTRRQPVEWTVLEQARAGDQDAWLEVVSRLHPRVSFAVHNWLSPQHVEHVEDLTQEVFLKVFRKLSRFDLSRSSRFTAWVLTIARNHCFDFRRAHRRGLRSIPDPESIPASVPGPMGLAAGSETLSQVDCALTELGEEQREAFELHYVHGLRYREISQRTGVPRNLVKSRANNARSRLRKRLKSLDPRSAA